MQIDKDTNLPEVIIMMNERQKIHESNMNRDEIFKREVREFIKYAQPILAKAKSTQDATTRILISVITVLLISVAGLLMEM